MKLLSIIVPVYNTEKYLDDCLKSITEELTNDMELIIIDDGSTDNSINIYNKYKNENVNIYQNTNHGVSYSRNYGIEKATGEYLLFVDADDTMEKGWCEKLTKLILMQKEDVMFILSELPNNQVDKMQLLNYIFKIENRYNWISTPWSKLYKREFLNNNNIRFIENIINGEDMLFNAEVILATNDILFTRNHIYNYCINPLSVTKSFNERLFESDKVFLDNLKKLFKRYERNYNKYYNFCIENAIVMFINKISLIKESDRKKYFYIFSQEPYFKFIKENRSFKKRFNKIIIYFIRKDKINIAIKINLLKCKIMRILKKNNKDEYLIQV